jgi:histidinol phosphatase-like enzyme
MKKTQIAFLDRDGVINSSRPNNGYVGLLKHFKWVPGAIKAIKFLNDKIIK